MKYARGAAGNERWTSLTGGIASARAVSILSQDACESDDDLGSITHDPGRSTASGLRSSPSISLSSSATNDPRSVWGMIVGAGMKYHGVFEACCALEMRTYRVIRRCLVGEST